MYEYPPSRAIVGNKRRVAIFKNKLIDQVYYTAGKMSPSKKCLRSIDKGKNTRTIEFLILFCYKTVD